jgi:hypothetical protein
MSLPGFTAMASLDEVNQRYRKAGTNFTLPGGEGVIPQLGTTMEDWWAQWMSGDGGGGGGGGSPSPCEINANQTYSQCLTSCSVFRYSETCRKSCLNNYVRDFGNCPH